MADPWRPRQSRSQRLATTQKTNTNFNLEGRLRQAAPVPLAEPGFEDQLILFIGDDDPGIDSGYPFWFDTNEPV